LIAKAATTYSTTFIVTAVLLIASYSLALAQGDRSGSERQSSETGTRAESLFQNALVLSDNQDSESARLRLQEAMHLWVQMREPGKAAKAALQMGDRCKQAKNYQDALNYYRQALDIKLLPGAVRANALNAIALIYSELYLHDLAVRYFNQALDQAHIINDFPAQTVALTGMADLYRQQGAWKEALAFVTKALRLSKKDQADADPALLYLKGAVSQEQGLFENAKGAFAEALGIYGNTGNVAGQVRVLCALSTLSLLVSQNQTALEQAEHAWKLAEGQVKPKMSFGDEVNARELRWRASLSRARAERALGQKKSALKSYFWAISHFKAMWWEFYIATETSALAFREEAQAAYREYIDLSMEQGQFKEAYELADEAKARVTLNLITARRGRPPSGDSKQAAILRELSGSIARLRLQLLASGLGREQQAKLEKEIEEAEYKMQEIRLQAEMKHSRERLVWSELANADQLQKQMARDQMALVEFSLGENRSFVWLFARGEFFFEILPARKEIEKAVRTYLDMLAATPNHLYIERELAKLKEQSEALFATLFGRLSSQIERDPRLIIVADGLLHYLPFEALIHSGRYLVEDHEISYNPSASMLLQRQDSRGGAETADRMELLAFGDPIFGDELKASVAKKPKSGPIDVIRSARASHGFQLPPLPRTRDEVQYIASLFPPDRTRLYLGKDACQTGRGRLLSSEGVVGLARAFLNAGARSVVVSLWSVSDISTGHLMKSFYQKLSGNLGNAAALRLAKLQLLQGPVETRHPYYWAPFIVVGKP